MAQLFPKFLNLRPFQIYLIIDEAKMPPVRRVAEVVESTRTTARLKIDGRLEGDPVSFIDIDRQSHVVRGIGRTLHFM